MGLQLTVMSLDFEADEAAKTQKFKKLEIKIGRDESNDLVLGSEAVSGEHALLQTEEVGGETIITVTDLGSTNGTLLDNRKLPAHTAVTLKENQRLMIGQYLIKPSALVNAASESDLLNDDPVIEDQVKPDIRIIKGGKVIKNDGDDDADLTSSSDSSEPSVLDKLTDKISKEDSDKLKEKKSKAKNTDKSESSKAKEFSISGKVGPDSTSFNLIAQKLVALSGIVLHKGQPLADAFVDAGSLGRVATGADGTFEIKGIIEGTEFDLEVQKESFIFDGKTFNGTVEESDELVFHATELFTVSGKIIHRGEPLSDVIIDAGELGETKTDSNGYYQFNEVPEGTDFSLIAKKDGFVFTSD